MSDTKLLQAIIDGQKAMEDRLHSEISKAKTSLSQEIQIVKTEVRKNGNRIDKIGLSLARLEDDSPTIAEFDKLEKRVRVLETKSVAA